MSKENNKEAAQQTYYDRSVKLFEEMRNNLHNNSDTKRLAVKHLHDAPPVLDKNGDLQPQDPVSILDKNPKGQRKREVALKELIAEAYSIPEISETQKKYFNSVEKVLQKDHERHRTVENFQIQTDVYKKELEDKNSPYHQGAQERINQMEKLSSNYQAKSRVEVEKLVDATKEALAKSGLDKPVSISRDQAAPQPELISLERQNAGDMKALTDLVNHFNKQAATDKNIAEFGKQYLMQDKYNEMKPDPQYTLDNASKNTQQIAMAIKEMGEKAQETNTLSPSQKLFMQKVAQVAEAIHEQSKEANHFAKEQQHYLPRLQNNSFNNQEQLRAEYAQREARHQQFVQQRANSIATPLPTLEPDNAVKMNSRAPREAQAGVAKQNQRKSMPKESQQKADKIGSTLKQQLLQKGSNIRKAVTQFAKEHLPGRG